MSNLMVTDLSLVMDVPPNLSKSVDICYLIFSKFPHDIIINASQQHNASYEVLLFPGLISFVVSSMLGRVPFWVLS